METIEKYIGKGRINYVLVNNAHISDELARKYEQEENKRPVYIEDRADYQHCSYKIIERDVVSSEDYIRHDPNKLATVINDFVTGWIK